jgi:hypothetical protein
VAKAEAEVAKTAVEVDKAEAAKIVLTGAKADANLLAKALARIKPKALPEALPAFAKTLQIQLAHAKTLPEHLAHEFKNQLLIGWANELTQYLWRCLNDGIERPEHVKQDLVNTFMGQLHEIILGNRDTLFNNLRIFFNSNLPFDPEAANNYTYVFYTIMTQ